MVADGHATLPSISSIGDDIDDIPRSKYQFGNVTQIALLGRVYMQPDLEKGIQYWSSVPATVDGVLGGFGTGVASSSLINSLLIFKSRLFLELTRSVQGFSF